MTENRKKQGPPRRYSKRREPSMIEGAANQLADAFDKLTDIFFQDTEYREEGAPPGVDISAITMSTDYSEDNYHRGISYSTSGGSGGSSTFMPSPPRLSESMVGSTASSAFTPLHRPIPNSSPSFANDSSFDSSAVGGVDDSFDVTEASSSISLSLVDSSMIESAIESVKESERADVSTIGPTTEVMLGSTPMARMRLDTVAQATQIEKVVPASPPRKSGEQAMADKHRKWRRQIKEAARRKEQEKRDHRREQRVDGDSTNVCSSTTNLLLGKDDPGRLFQHLMKTTAIRCGGLDDTASGLFSEETSEASSISDHKTLTPPRGSPASRTGVVRTRRLAGPSENGTTHHAKGSMKAEKAMSEKSFDKSFESAKSMLSQLDMQDRNFIKAFIHETSQEGYPLIWHKPSSDGRTFENPIQIVTFLELGFLQTDDNFAGPRLAWYTPDGAVQGAIDLLDIRSSSKASPLQLSDFPFAIPGNSLILKLHNSFDELVLEASSPEDSRRFTHGLRWVVARLTFNLIIGNPEVSCELLELRETPHNGPLAEMNKAMNDVTNQLVEKAVFAHPQQLV